MRGDSRRSSRIPSIESRHILEIERGIVNASDSNRSGGGMARTPLLRALQRLARDHRQAEALGLSPAELREHEHERAYSRGEFLKRSGTAGAIALAGPGVLALAA